LRHETRDAHERVERASDLPAAATTEHSYVIALRRLHPAFFGVFNALAQIDGAAGRLAADEAYVRTARLERDLTAFGKEALPNPGMPFHLRDGDEALGCEYVMRGSSLGGLVIFKQACTKLYVTPQADGEFFHGDGDKTKLKWMELLESLSALKADNLRPARIVVGANVTFSWIETALHGKLYNLVGPKKTPDSGPELTDRLFRNRRDIILPLVEKKRLELSVVEVRHLISGIRTVRACEKLDRSLVLVEGIMSRYVRHRGSRQTLGINVPGDFVDLRANLVKTLRCDIVTFPDVVAAVVPNEALEEFGRDHPALERKLSHSALLEVHPPSVVVSSRSSRRDQPRSAPLCEAKVGMMLASLSNGHQFRLNILPMSAASRACT
jgi:heme oxygenase